MRPNTSNLTRAKEAKVLNDEERNKAAQIQAAMRQRLDALRADATIVPRERQRRMARAVIEARRGIAEISTKAAARQDQERATAYKKLFGISADRPAEDRMYRDGLAARVAEGSLNAAGAKALYDLAAARGDDVAMRALAELAWSRSGDELGGNAWHPLLDEFRAGSDAREAAMSSLVSIVSPDRLTVMRERMELEVPQPSDLPGNLDQLASDAESASDWSSAG